VESPSNLMGNWTSAYITFGQLDRQLWMMPRGFLVMVIPTKGCELGISSAAPNSIALTWEATVLTECTNMTIFYEKLQALQNFTGAVVGTEYIVYSDRPLGYKWFEDPSNITIPVEYIPESVYKTFISAITTETISVIISNDLGPFYHFSLTGMVLASIIIFPMIYLSLFIYAIYFLYYEIRILKKGFSRPSQVCICLLLFTLGRSFRVIFFNRTEIFLLAPYTVSELIGADIVLWFPLGIGSFAFYINLFTWLDIIVALERNNLILMTRRPLQALYILLVVVTVIIPIIFEPLHLSVFEVMIAVFLVSGFAQAVLFLFYGIKILRLISSTLLQTKEVKSKVLRTLTIFVIASTVLWIAAAILVVIFEVGAGKGSPETFFACQVIREVLLLGLVFCIMFLLVTARKNNMRSANPSPNNQLTENIQNEPIVDQGGGTTRSPEILNKPK